MNRFQSRTVLVTGGGSGIGLAVARAFLEEGAQVAICGRDLEKLQRAAAQLPFPERLVLQAADMTQPAQVQALVQLVLDRFGRMDILVNNAGLNIKQRSVRELNPETWRLLVENNLNGAFFCTHAVLPHMLQRREGLIIFINSTSGKRSAPGGGAAYSAAKFGIRAFGLCLAEEMKDSGIRVSVIYPGDVNTPILDTRPYEVSAAHRQQILQPEDLAEAVLFVASLPPRASVPELVIKPTGQTYL